MACSKEREKERKKERERERLLRSATMTTWRQIRRGVCVDALAVRTWGGALGSEDCRRSLPRGAVEKCRPPLPPLLFLPLPPPPRPPPSPPLLLMGEALVAFCLAVPICASAAAMRDISRAFAMISCTGTSRRERRGGRRSGGEEREAW